MTCVQSEEGRGHLDVLFISSSFQYFCRGRRGWIYKYMCNSIKHYVIKFASDLRQVGGFLRVLRFPLTIKLTASNHDTTEILLKVA